MEYHSYEQIYPKIANKTSLLADLEQIDFPLKILIFIPD
jgi:hypothetical protein